jgi:Immunity protein 35
MTMITRDDAREIAEQQLRELYVDGADALAIDDRATREEDFGWIFFYQSKKFLNEADADERLVGNAPIVVDRDGEVHMTGTGEPLDRYLAEIRTKLGF